MSAGTRVAAGRLRVDAARAVDKLRDYQLPDPTMWILEVIRAAVLAGAERIAVTGDGDDVRVAWRGPPIPAARVATLFDELVDPAPKADHRHLRLLATGVNTALGMEPRWLDVISVGEDAQRVRFTPGLLKVEEGVAEGLRRLTPEPTVPPPEALGPGVVVHLKRLPQWNAVPILIGIGEPAELAVARRCCDDLAVPIAVGGATLGRERSHRDLLRVSLGEGLDGFLAVLDPASARGPASLELAELGVLLVRYTWPLTGFHPELTGLPLRLYLDANRLPTNASRSAVRLTDPPVRDALERGRELLPAVVARLASELEEGPSRTWTESQRERLRAAAVQLLAARASGRLWRAALRGVEQEEDAASALAPLLALPLLRDALGRPRSPASFPLGEGDERVSFADTPYEAELEPWLGHVLWVPPGDPARALLGDWVPARASELAKLARKHRKARARFQNEAPRPNTLQASDVQLLAVPLKAPGRSLKSIAPTELFDVPGLEGELALLDPRRARAGAVSVRLGGREIELLQPDRSLLYEAVVTRAGLVPHVDFRSVRRDPGYVSMCRALDAAAVVACEGLALRVSGKRKQGDRSEARVEWIDAPDAAHLVAGVLRRGVYLAAQLLADGRNPDALRAQLASSNSPLLRAAIWPTVDGSLHTARDVLRTPRPLGVCFGAAPGGPAPSGRLVLVLDREERDDALSLFGPMVDYRPVLIRERTEPEPTGLARRETPPHGVGLEIEGPHLRAAVVWGGERRELVVRHWGHELETRVVDETTTPCRVVVEDGLVVPGEGWRSVASPRAEGYPLARWEGELARAFVDALTGKPPPALAVGPENPFDAHGARHALFDLMQHAEGSLERVLTSSRLRALSGVPLFERLGAPERHSVDQIMEAFRADPIPFVPLGEAAGVELDGWHPVLASASMVKALERWTGRAFADGRDQLEGLRRRARRARALELHRRQRQSDPTVTWARPRVPVKGRTYRSAVAAPASVEDGGTLIHAQIEGRSFVELRVPDGPPVWLAIDLDEDCADEELRGLTDAAERMVRRVSWRGARVLLRAIAESEPTSWADAPRTFALLRAWVAKGSKASADQKLRTFLGEIPAWRTVQGGRTSLADAAGGSGDLRVGAWDGHWLEPDEGERRSALDAPVIALPAQEEKRGALRELLGALWGKGSTRDVGGALAKLQSKRRVARGIERRPAVIAPPDPRFCVPLEVLLANVTDPRAEVIGVGEVALVREAPSRLLLFDRGEHTRSIEANVIPSVVVAMTSPLVDEAGMASLQTTARNQLMDALKLIVSHVIRHVVDEVPRDQLPPWVREALRDSCLAGDGLHYERLNDVPLFLTTSERWVTPDELKEQAARFGEVWFTPYPIRAEPLEPGRVVLQITSAEAARLESFVPVVDGTEELQLDAVARENQARPRLESLELTEAEALGAAVIERVEGFGAAHGLVAVLRPGFEHLRGLHLSRAMLPMGTHADGTGWPWLARIDHPELEVNRTHDGPSESGVQLALLRGHLRERVDAALAQLIAEPQGVSLSLRVHAGLLPSLGLEGFPAVEGVIWLEESEPGSAPATTITLRDGRGERTLFAEDGRGRSLPLCGQLWAAGILDAHRVGSLVTALYAASIAKAARAVAERGDERMLGHVLGGAARGVDLDAEGFPSVMLACFRPPTTTLASLVEHLGTGQRVIRCTPAEVDAAEDAATPRPLFVDDGGETARLVAAFLGDHALPWSLWLREQVLGDAPPEPPPAPVVVPSTAPAGEEGRPTPAPPKRASTPLEAALEARFAAMEVAAVGAVFVDGRKKRPLAEALGHVVQMAGRHRAVQEVASALAADDPRSDELVRLLAARVLGTLHRDAARFGQGGEMALLIDLLA
ncbi:MAG: hypothetical protein SangKO_023510 [Sandaracinaceae bacterium]